MAKVLMFIDDGFQDMEAMYPYYRLQEAGYTVDVVGMQKGRTYAGKYGYPLVSTVAPGEVRVADYAAVVIPGGQAPDHMRVHPELVGLLRDAAAQNLVIAAICHGPQMLIEADMVRGRRMTAYKAVRTDLVNAGAVFQDAPAVVDGRFVTSRTPDDLPAFCRELLALLSREKEAK